MMQDNGNKTMQIVVLGHKPFTVPDDSIYLGMQVGFLPDIPSLQRDNTGDNIAGKNRTYCELTAQYWLWKNSDADIKGLVHYRRILGSPNSHAVPFESMEKRRGKAVTGEEVESILRTSDIIVPKAHHYVTETALQHYNRSHISGEGFTIIRDYLSTHYPEYVSALDDVLADRESHLFNILIAPRSIFDSYSRWLFEVLSVVEQRLDISGYSPVKQRVFGYLSELLLDTWIQANKLRYAELPMLFLQRQNLLARYAKGALRKAGIINPAAEEQKKMMEARR
ncbi:DUF4422 domain-containing protein [Bifidobacterium mongoliense]|uniref:DUF4422 domain-containing protein n=1 Tax=Bifidobacterium mongoliense TaxID=518643 RepID=UPI0030EB38D7